MSLGHILLVAFLHFCFCKVVTAGAADPNGPIIGIDLGTTYSCVGIYQNGRVHIIANSQGERTTPSWVSFRGSERLIGDSAKHAFHAAPGHTIYAVKRIIGRTFDDPELQKDIENWPFDVVNRGDRPVIQVHQDGGNIQSFVPEEISAMVLSQMKQTAEAYLGKPITRAVVTVPARFNDAQRQATKNAGIIAGLDIVRMVNEPTAAALAYGLDRKNTGSSNIIVYDLGGGTLDVSLVSFKDGVFRVVGTAGDAHLGGEDFDSRIIDYFASMYQRTSGIDITSNYRSMSKLKKEAERAKRLLSTQQTVNIEIEALYRGRDFSAVLSRAKFEQVNQDLFRKSLEPVRKVLADAKIKPRDIDEVVLVGGSTRIPKVQSFLQDMFRGKKISHGINPDEAVATGAAIHAGVLAGEPGLEDIQLADVCPFTIGIETIGGVFAPFIHRNTPLPATHSEKLATTADNQRSVVIQVFEGEHSKSRDNHLIGEFELSGIPPAARGIVQIDIQFNVDVDGILRVEATEKVSGSSNSITISSRRSALSEEELEEMKLKSRAYGKVSKFSWWS
ncbi:hypothetical protein RSAG8_12551, partial [Rhizoctonia solani AG-8 WAC10335]